MSPASCNDVGGLVVADDFQVLRHVHPDLLAEVRERVGVHQLVVAELLQPLAVEGVFEMFERERVVQDRDVGIGHLLGRRFLCRRLFGRRLRGRHLGHLLGGRRGPVPATATASKCDGTECGGASEEGPPRAP
jgi:hypothetical protein